jgi:hypothetical protein
MYMMRKGQTDTGRRKKNERRGWEGVTYPHLLSMYWSVKEFDSRGDECNLRDTQNGKQKAEN